MTSIIGYGELMQETELNAKQKRYLQSITQSSSYLLTLVNDLLDVAKFKDQRVELTPKEVELGDILSECVTLIESKIASEVEFKTDLPSLDYKIKADDKRLKQIILNLLANAAKFTKEGSIEFILDPIEKSVKGELSLTLHIKDTGIGIPEEVKETLFEPFSSTDKTQGTGLGLFISRELSKLMGGSIEVQSTEEEGSHFILKVMVERASKKEIGKKLIGSRILMCSPKDDFMNDISTQLHKMGMNGFEHLDTNVNDMSMIVRDFLPHAGRYDILIFDVDAFTQDVSALAKMFKVLNPKIKLIAYVNKQNTQHYEHFDLMMHQPIRYQKFIVKIEQLYHQKKGKKSLKKSYSDLNILLVEDVEINRIYEVEMLKNVFGVTCDTAENGSIAVEKVKENEYDVILMDVRMPVMNGLDATRSIRRFNKDIPILCMSANVYKEDKIAAEESGMNDFIEKPLERVDIENKLTKLLENGFKKRRKEVFDYEQFVKNNLRKNFEEAIVSQLYTAAQESIEEGLSNIENAFELKEFSILMDEFHRLKGILLNVGLKECAELASRLQQHAKDHDLLALGEYRPLFMKRMQAFLKSEG
jgi:CheY-like chemotaxis protein